MNYKKKRVGVVVSNKSKKTVVVLIQRKYQHFKYTKTLIKTKRYMAHDEQQLCKEGDFVMIIQTSPVSCKKAWLIKKIY